ncbi:MAG: hypothetical protein LWX56_00435 [Ignavibacteria bacterium]|nr:hypothetical protein [Ignavibacteria bacterium]
MKYYFLFLILFSFSCTQQNSRVNHCEIFNGIGMACLNSEKIEPISEPVKDLYTKLLFSSSGTPVPLFRHITGTGYHIFIGIPYNTSINQLAEQICSKNGVDEFEKSSGDEYFYCTYKKGDYYICEYVFSREHKSVIYLATAGREKSVRDSLFQLSQFQKRFAE